MAKVTIKKNKQSSYAHIRSLTKNTAYAKGVSAGSKGKNTMAQKTTIKPKAPPKKSLVANFSSMTGQQLAVTPDGKPITEQHFSSADANTSTPTGPVHTPAPATTPPITGGYREATPKEQFFATPIGTAISDIKEGLLSGFMGTRDPTGADPISKGTAFTGALTAGAILGLGPGGKTGQAGKLTTKQARLVKEAWAAGKNGDELAKTFLANNARILESITRSGEKGFRKLGFMSKADNAVYTEVAAAQRIGTLTPKATTTAENIAVNTKNIALTKSWLTRVFTERGRPKLVAVAAAGMLGGAIGSYPFTHWAKGEAWQNIARAREAALWDGDIEGAERALALELEIVNPNFISRVMEKLPYLNSIDALQDIIKAARLSAELGRRRIEDKKIELENPEMDENDMWDLRHEQQAAEEDRQRALQIEHQQQILEMKARYEDEQRTAQTEEVRARAELNAQYWAEQSALQAQRDADQLRAQKEYWEWFWREQAANRDENTPSKLNFGLL